MNLTNKTSHRINMNKFKDCVAVITGAGSGIGRELCYQLANFGARLAISDIDKQNLLVTKMEAEAKGAQVVATVLDVSDEEAMYEYAEHCNDTYGCINLVVNNAGVALSAGPLWNTPIEDFKWLMSINFYGVLFGTYAFLPYLNKSSWGHIVNISSLFGLVSTTNQSAYSASKFAVRGLTETLRQELKHEQSHVSCICVHPGGVKTNIAQRARVSDNGQERAFELHKEAAEKFDKSARTTAESAASQILRAIVSDKPRLLIGTDAKLIDKIQRLIPTKYPSILNALINN